MHCAAQRIVLDHETWEAFPIRGQAVVHHGAYLYVIGGKRCARGTSNASCVVADISSFHTSRCVMCSIALSMQGNKALGTDAHLEPGKDVKRTVRTPS